MRQKIVAGNWKMNTTVAEGIELVNQIIGKIEEVPQDVKLINRRADRRRKLLEAARDGDEQAMQTITMEDMDTYSDLIDKVQESDILTLVDSFFMPTGAECDVYYILGEILACRQVRNPYN